jgi:hypothetical protein
MNDIQNSSHIIHDENNNEDDINEASDIGNKPNDSLLKEIYTG